MRGMSQEEKMKYLQRLAEQQRKAAEEQESIAMQQALGANDKQWKVIEPKLKKVKQYREQAFIGPKPPFQSTLSSFRMSPGGGQGFGVGFGFSSDFQFKAGGNAPGAMDPNSTDRQDFDSQVADGEIICEEIQRLLTNPEATPEQISQKLDALRKARFRQQARLVLMGLLD